MREVEQFQARGERNLGHRQRNASSGVSGKVRRGFLNIRRSHASAGGVGDGEIPSRAIGIEKANAIERLLAGHDGGVRDIEALGAHFLHQPASGRIVADSAHRQGFEIPAHQALHIVADDMQLAVVAAVEELPAPALLAAERVVSTQREEGSGADASGADHGIVFSGGVHGERID